MRGGDRRQSKTGGSEFGKSDQNGRRIEFFFWKSSKSLLSGGSIAKGGIVTQFSEEAKKSMTDILPFRHVVFPG
jgi:hypothetical protein